MTIVSSAMGAVGAQKNHLRVTVGSGDPLDVRQYAVQQRMSSLFQISLVVHSKNANVDFDAVVGHPATFTILTNPLVTLGEPPHWEGICNHMQQVGAEITGASTYQLSIVPSLWLATQRRNFRMFQQISEPDIVLQLLEEWQIEPIKHFDAGAYKKRKYRVQYGESDFAFLSRMLEDAGIAYFFEQHGAETKLVLSEAPQKGALRLRPLSFRDNPTGDFGREENATHVRFGQQVRPGKMTFRDHDYRLPPTYNLAASAKGDRSVEDRLEGFHYTPGAFLFGSDKGDSTPVADDRGKTRTDEGEAAILAQKRLDAKRGDAKVCTFESNALDLAPGVVLRIEDHPRAEISGGKGLLLVESSLSGTSDGEGNCHCEARSAEAAYRPPLVTRKPETKGVESATVVGPKGEEIHTDEFGRIRVHFHWDRESQMDEKSSCWLHVSQPWGGSGYGGVNLPRIGQEVLVDFLGGDPDRPVIVGRMYTNLQKLPYKLPDNKTQSGWRSNSTGGGGGYNEIMFEDAEGKELVNIQAQKDLTETIKHDETTTVWNNSTNVVGSQHSLTIGAPDQSKTAGSFPPTPGMTSATMSDDNILQKTSNASIAWTATDVNIVASNSISLSANGAAITLGGKERTITIDAETVVVVHAKDVVNIDGDNFVYINCKKPAAKYQLPQPTLGEMAKSALEGGVMGMATAVVIAAAPVVGVVVGLAMMADAAYDGTTSK